MPAVVGTLASGIIELAFAIGLFASAAREHRAPIAS
jgi:hypothetical protein